MIELVRSGRSAEALSREFEPTAQTIRNWVAQADRDEGLRSDGLTTAEREEVRRLRREVKRLRMERDILKKATAWFARETGSVPPKPTDS
jgi:transposase